MVTRPAGRITDFTFSTLEGRYMQSTTPSLSAAMPDTEAAEYIGVHVGWLRKNRNADFTPPFMRYGARTIRYLRTDLDEWLDAQRVAA